MDLVIIGSGGHARVVAESAILSGFVIKGFIDLNFKQVEENIIGYPILGNIKSL